MMRRKANNKTIFLWMTVALVLGIFAGTPFAVHAATVLPAPGNPHWDGNTGTAVWDNVPDSGTQLGADGVAYVLRLFKKTTQTPPSPTDTDYIIELRPDGNTTAPTYSMSLSSYLTDDNCYYYFTVAAAGDGTTHTESPFAVSDDFFYTAPTQKLPTPTGLAWNPRDGEYYATCTNMSDYVDADEFIVSCFNEAGERLGTSVWPKDEILYGVPLSRYMTASGRYYFKIQVNSSRPLEYLSSEVSAPSDLIAVGTPPIVTSPGTSSGSSSRSSSGDSSGTPYTPPTTTKTTISAERLGGGGSQQTGNYSWRVDLPTLGFQSATVGGYELVRGEDYTIRSGSTVLTLTDSYLSTLRPGSYTLHMEFLSATAAIDFTVEPTGSSGGADASQSSEAPALTASNNTNMNPSTGR